ncbi:ABC transporter ATP-binding protein [Rubrobacter aplysinae]|uniref:ABC transporter ATP-binding protein n=1 Tax=Rubrobacter aplysinae TaxID=909625 RepID=UPI00064BE923|nr:ABC transporter ATP-binding protein [Rubrobacter aplysinae]
MLEISDLSVRYGEFLALRGVSLEVAEGELVVVLGANGAGKSTLFRTINGLMKPDSGEITFQGSRIDGRPANAVVKAGIAQSAEGRHLFPELSVQKNLTLGAYLRRRDRAGVKSSIERVYELFPILYDKRNDPAGSLSGGQQQMVAIGRALMAEPRLLILDEPSLGLAPLVTKQMLEAVVEINHGGITVLLAEQNAQAALGIAHKGYVIENGLVTLEGTRDELMDNSEVRRAYMGA